MDVYGFVNLLKGMIVALTAILTIVAGRIWWRTRPAGDGLEGSYGDRLSARPGILQVQSGPVVFWWFPFLMAGLLQWLIGLDSPAGRWNFLGWLGLAIALIMAHRQTRIVRARKDRALPRGVARRQKGALALTAFLVTLLWMVGLWRASFYLSQTADLRNFDPDAVARLETAMWRSYYDKQRIQLFLQLRELMAAQYRFPRLSSFQEAYLAARAAFVFKAGKNRRDYEKALPYLEAYFREIRRIGNLSFDPQAVAARELEWWIVHRQQDRYSVEDLAQACARLMESLYQAPLSRVLEHGRLRAEAMKIRDRRAEAGGVTDQDWIYIEGLLRRAYRSLLEAIHQPSSQALKSNP